MRVATLLLLLLVTGLTGCVTSNPHDIAQSLAQSARADTHLGWQSAPEHQLSYSIATASGIARVRMQELPEDLQSLNIEMPGMRSLEGVLWRAGDGDSSMLYDGVHEADGVSVERQNHGFSMQLTGAALETIRAGGLLTLIDYYR